MSVYICVPSYISICMYMYAYVCVYMHIYSAEKFTQLIGCGGNSGCTPEISTFAVSFLAHAGPGQLCRGNGERARVSGGARRGMATSPPLDLHHPALRPILSYELLSTKLWPTCHSHHEVGG